VQKTRGCPDPGYISNKGTLYGWARCDQRTTEDKPQFELFASYSYSRKLRYLASQFGASGGTTYQNHPFSSS